MKSQKENPAFGPGFLQRVFCDGRRAALGPNPVLPSCRGSRVERRTRTCGSCYRSPRHSSTARPRALSPGNAMPGAGHIIRLSRQTDQLPPHFLRPRHPARFRLFPFPHAPRIGGKILSMQDAKAALDRYFLEMRWRCLSLAADLDRVERSPGGEHVVQADPRLQKLRAALGALGRAGANRAEQVQSIFSDKTPPPQ